MKKRKINIIGIVPNNEVALNAMKKYLSNIKYTEVGSTKGMIFIKSFTDTAKVEILKYLNSNKNLFKYAA